jgi:pimeloyl-ACP methyl ester carboxylesterase
MKRALALVIALLASVCVTGTSAAEQAPACQDVQIPVHLDLLLPVDVSGRLCLPAPGVDRVHLLVPGATYDSRYWDVAYGDGAYAYTPRANADGWATLAIDTVGYGRSTPVPSVSLTTTAQALALHQIIGQLRSGAIGGHAFGTVLLVGHSVGSGIALVETSMYDDADALAVTGLAHHISPTRLTQIFATDLRPVSLYPDSPLAQRYDTGYITTVPGTRGSLFHGQDADPGLVAYDEQTKGAISATEASDFVATSFALPVSLGDRLPTYLVDGGADQLFCVGPLAANCADAATLRAEEAPYFASAPSFTATVLPDSGHDLNFDPNAATYEHDLFAWADRTLG